MTASLPQYPDFADIRIRHVLTHTTGLSWTEEGRPWVSWVMSDDWIATALARGREREPGKTFKYSSANSQFLSGLIHAVTGQTPGELAETSLFPPLGIPFHRLTEVQHYDNWDEYKVPPQDLVLVIKYEAVVPVDPVPGTAHDDMRLFELVVQSVIR